MDDYNKIKNRILEIGDPNSSYTQEDFDNEFKSYSFSSVSYDDVFKIKLKVLNKSKNKNPEYATDGSSGFDLRADLELPIIIPSGKREIVPTGLYFEIPDNFEIQVRPRSGLAAKFGVTVLNTPGTIDSDYRGEIKVILINHGDSDFTINNGDRIAQAVLATAFTSKAVEIENITVIEEDTTRGANGFGSTGLS